MELHTLIEWGFVGLFSITSLIEIAPIKVNPWSAILKKIGSLLNTEVVQKIEKLDSRVDALEVNFVEMKKTQDDIKKAQDEESAMNSRTKIVRFSDELVEDKNFTKSHFDTILIEINRYESYCNKHPDFINNIAKMAIDYIERIYQRKLENNDFLKED